MDAFSDAVFAIAITLLVLELPFEKVGEGELLAELAHHWASFVTYAVSFLTIGIAWMHHHAMWDQIAHPTRPLLVLNLLSLMTIALIPFPTGLLAEYVRTDEDAEVAAVVFGIAWTLAAAGNALVWAYASRRRELLREEITDAGIRGLRRVFGWAAAAYVLFTAVAAVSAEASLALFAITAAVVLWRGDFRAVGQEEPLA